MQGSRTTFNINSSWNMETNGNKKGSQNADIHAMLEKRTTLANAGGAV